MSSRRVYSQQPQHGLAFSSDRSVMEQRYEVYGFAGWVLSIMASAFYLFYSLAPEWMLHQAGVTYYPAKYWVLALPAWVVMTAGLLWCAYMGYNLAKSPAFDDSAVWTDVHAKRVLDPANAAPPLLNPHAPAMGSPMPSAEIPELTDLPLNWVNRVMFSDQQAALGSPSETAWPAGDRGSAGPVRGPAGSHAVPPLAPGGRLLAAQTLLRTGPGDLRDTSSSALPSGLAPLTLRLPHSHGQRSDTREYPAAAQPAVQQLDTADDTEPLTPMVDADQLMANLLRGLTSTATPQPVPSTQESSASRSDECGQVAGQPRSVGQSVGLLDMPHGAAAALAAGRPRGPTEMSAFSFGLLSDDGDDDSAGS